MNDRKDEITSKILDAFHNKKYLRIHAGNTKYFYGREIKAEPLSIEQHTGIVEYEPSELYITARSGTPLVEIEQAISKQNQILPCEPPYFGAEATLGGMVACGLAGPRRVNAGNVRDCVLGVEILNGKGELLRFGGKVMKNVAGYDVSRLMCGALGTLGVLMSISVRLLPKPESEQTIVLTLDDSTAIKKMNQWANTPMPISATYYDGSELYVRLSSSASAVEACKKEIGGNQTEEHEIFWSSIKEQTHDFFSSDIPLWRISVPPNTQTLNIPGVSVMEWNGALRWYRSDADENTIRSEANRVGGQANLFRGNTTANIFHPLSEASMKIHSKLKHALDPAGILNPGKMFAEL